MSVYTIEGHLLILRNLWVAFPVFWIAGFSFIVFFFCRSIRGLLIFCDRHDGLLPSSSSSYV